MLTRFGTFSRYLHFDKRGTGSSDHGPSLCDDEQRVRDLLAILDAAEIDRAHLIGTTEGGPLALRFAAQHPERVTSLLLFGTGATLRPPQATPRELAVLRARHRELAERWGTERSEAAALLAPSLAASDPSFVAWHRRYERFAASSDALARLLEATLHLDARDVVGQVQAPALVAHRVGDQLVDVARARELAAQLPDARLLELPGDDHVGYAGDVDAWMRPFEEVVTGRAVRRRASPTRSRRVWVRTLGGFAVHVDGRSVPPGAWGSRRARQLAKRLVIARGDPVTRDELIELLWPDSDAPRERLGARLSVQLTSVRKVLVGGVQADRDVVRLDRDVVSTDLDQLLRATDDQAILDAHQGPFLPEDVYEAWTDATRQAVHVRFVVAARRRAREHVRAGAWPAALELADRLLTVEPDDPVALSVRGAALTRAT